jgi:hypothetical protein
MQSFLSDLQSLFESEIRKYNEAVSKHCLIDLNSLQKVADQYFSGNLTNSPIIKAANPLLDTPQSLLSETAGRSTPRVAAKAASGKKTGKCPYVFKSGKQSGQTCGVSCEEGGACAKHKSSVAVAKPAPAEEESEESETETVAPVAKPAAKTATKTTAAKAAPAPKPVVAKVKAEQDTGITSVRKNKWGNYEEQSTGFVFDRETQEVVGRQNPDGTVAPLTLNDIELCKANGFAYKMPERFKDEAPNKKVTVKDIPDDDLYEDDDDD